MTSAPEACRIRRMTLMAASCPSNREAAVTRRTWCCGRYGAGTAGFSAGVPSTDWEIPHGHGGVYETPHLRGCGLARKHHAPQRSGSSERRGVSSLREYRHAAPCGKSVAACGRRGRQIGYPRQASMLALERTVFLGAVMLALASCTAAP